MMLKMCCHSSGLTSITKPGLKRPNKQDFSKIQKWDLPFQLHTSHLVLVDSVLIVDVGPWDLFFSLHYPLFVTVPPEYIYSVFDSVYTYLLSLSYIAFLNCFAHNSPENLI